MTNQSQFSLYIGVGETKDGYAITKTERKNGELSIKQWAAELFGGYSMLQLNGGWINPNNELVQEPAIKLEILTKTDNATLVREFAKQCKELFNQEHVLMTVRNLDELELI